VKVNVEEYIENIKTKEIYRKKEEIEMNSLEKIFTEKLTENGDKAYNTTGNNLTDLLFMTSFFEKHLDEAHIGSSEKEKVFSMFLRDPRFGLGRRDLGRRLMKQAGVNVENIVKAGRYDDLYHIATDECISTLKEALYSGNELAKKWMPRLTGKDKKIAKTLCKMWNITEKEYRKLIKTDKTVEYKLSYTEKQEGTELNELFKQGIYKHPLVDEIDFEQVPSLAMTKYLNTFSTREDIKPRFSEYIKALKENKVKVNTSTANVYDANKTVRSAVVSENADVIGKKIIDNATLGVEMSVLCVLDSSGSMFDGEDTINKATSICHALATHSTYCKNQCIGFSRTPKLLNITGNTLEEQYATMWNHEVANTDFGAVMKLLQGLKSYPDYILVASDMEFDSGSNQSKKETMRIFKQHEANTKIIWWNFNTRNKTVPEFDEYGNIYLSGYNLQFLKLLENKFDMTSYIEKLLEEYKKNIDYKG
jgi:hypothetical protein